ncbi:MAG: hypothetical protein DRI39_03050 [Chloroflexi bacterium]|nr:MAG: hypothetical protein DRI40_08380 [Chloroflexota bacterium]RLC94393.1 MAG: hypothetical protein DRI39_03050 [Chloroflexota bacterium]
MTEPQVQCYSGREYAERPMSFTWRGVAHTVKAVEKEWREPGAKCFRVSTVDDGLFELCYNEQQDEWSICEPGGKELG